MKTLFIALVFSVGLAYPALGFERPRLEAADSAAAQTEVYDVYGRCDVNDPWEYIGEYDHLAEAQLTVNLLKSYGCEGFIKARAVNP